MNRDLHRVRSLLPQLERDEIVTVVMVSTPMRDESG